MSFIVRSLLCRAVWVRGALPLARPSTSPRQEKLGIRRASQLSLRYYAHGVMDTMVRRALAIDKWESHHVDDSDYRPCKRIREKPAG